jgi:hypothetical protein
MIIIFFLIITYFLLIIYSCNKLEDKFFNELYGKLKEPSNLIDLTLGLA